MPQLVVIYDVDEAGAPVAILSSGEAGLVGAVARLFADRLGVAAPPRVLELAKSHT